MTKKTTDKGNGNGNGLSTSMNEEIDAQLGHLCKLGMDAFLEKVVNHTNVRKLKAIEHLAKDLDQKRLYNYALRRRLHLTVK